MAGNDSTHFKRLAEEAKVSYIAIKGYPRNMNTHTVIVEWKYVSIMLASKVGPCTTDSFYIIILSLSFPLHPFLSSSPPAWRLCYPSLTPHTWSSTRPPPHGEDVKCYQLYFHVEKTKKKKSLITELRQCRVQTSRAPWSCWFREIMWGEVKCVKSVSSNRHISPLPQATYAHTHTPESTQSDREQVFCLLLHQ